MLTSIPLADPAGDRNQGDWRHRAACRDEDPELFFPIGNKGAAMRLQIAEAKGVCYRCPVRLSCGSWALESGQDHGVWGGMSEDERRALKAAEEEQAAATAPAKDVHPGGIDPTIDLAEVAHLRDFGMTDQAIARKLGIKLDTLRTAERRARQNGRAGS